MWILAETLYGGILYASLNVTANRLLLAPVSMNLDEIDKIKFSQWTKWIPSYYFNIEQAKGQRFYSSESGFGTLPDGFIKTNNFKIKSHMAS